MRSSKTPFRSIAGWSGAFGTSHRGSGPRRRYMQWFKTQLGVQRLDDWYHLSKQHFLQGEGGGLLARFGDLPSAVLKDYLPQREWLECGLRTCRRTFGTSRGTAADI